MAERSDEAMKYARERVLLRGKYAKPCADTIANDFDAGRASRDGEVAGMNCTIKTLEKQNVDKNAEIARLNEQLVNLCANGAVREGDIAHLEEDIKALTVEKRGLKERTKALEAVAEAARGEVESNHDGDCDCDTCLKLAALDALSALDKDKEAKKK